jgi:hypothetical protein
MNYVKSKDEIKNHGLIPKLIALKTIPSPKKLMKKRKSLDMKRLP